mmetsp:Transcript_11402/g.27054  ORF Transcript_11402/g.27054 Transcript_11402/m.27054 type:complete len:212 (+) Transcript_11402:495-1130(+)
MRQTFRPPFRGAVSAPQASVREATTSALKRSGGGPHRSGHLCRVHSPDPRPRDSVDQPLRGAEEVAASCPGVDRAEEVLQVADEDANGWLHDALAEHEVQREHGKREVEPLHLHQPPDADALLLEMAAPDVEQREDEDHCKERRDDLRRDAGVAEKAEAQHDDGAEHIDPSVVCRAVGKDPCLEGDAVVVPAGRGALISYAGIGGEDTKPP